MQLSSDGHPRTCASQQPNSNGSKQAPFKRIRFRDHAPATSHGTYLEGSRDGLEDLEGYEEGGYHPIHLGDTLDDECRYRVVHKLGHGGFGTVWLCRDIQDSKYVAIKVIMAGVDAADMIDLDLDKLDRTAQGAEFIGSTRHYFSLQGPNGAHECLVLPLLGPRVSPSL